MDKDTLLNNPSTVYNKWSNNDFLSLSSVPIRYPHDSLYWLRTWIAPPLSNFILTLYNDVYLYGLLVEEKWLLLELKTIFSLSRNHWPDLRKQNGIKYGKYLSCELLFQDGAQWAS